MVDSDGWNFNGLFGIGGLRQIGSKALLLGFCCMSLAWLCEVSLKGQLSLKGSVENSGFGLS